MPRRDELLKLKFDMVYRGMAKDKSEEKFNAIVAPVPVPTPAPTPAPKK
jgi:hypothetical protein